MILTISVNFSCLKGMTIDTKTFQDKLMRRTELGNEKFQHLLTLLNIPLIQFWYEI